MAAAVLSGDSRGVTLCATILKVFKYSSMMGLFRFTSTVFRDRRHRRHHRINNFASTSLLVIATTFIITSRDFSFISAYSPSSSGSGVSGSSGSRSSLPMQSTSAASETAAAAAKNEPKLFAYQHILPPLLVDDSSSSASSSSSYDYSQSIPCLYTNNIASASQWVDEHILNCNNMNSKSKNKNSSDGKVEEEEVIVVVEPIILGWDMESSPNLPWRETTNDSYLGPATLQLSTVTNTLVFQIAQDKYGPLCITTGGLPKFMNAILENTNIIKTGVAIDDDFIELYRWIIFDMGKIGSISEGSNTNNGNQISLGRLVQGILGVTIPKSKQLARSPWSRVPLTTEEITYAARDAWAAAAIMHKLNSKDENNDNQFSPQSIINKLNEPRHLQSSINDISYKQAKRKNLKLEYKELKEYNNNKRNRRQSGNYIMSSNEENTTEEEDKENELREDILWNEMKQLAPISPIEYDISSLNLFIE
ncbi:hypothetical protein FRACYDRAFT_246840 [Fragilariopsis cylindrus CCMP1102]|uniref:3'-5' exonuclease domain-containing protein n=1 Tax=Fragilariopsis cylindrus CCMP1102 TaxID=635003 RepID=A0A1E7EX89_9STRA|nr:hypothetical protein FRACYDRAFT_246840 [Fragilariopsis cylindrus CCMP1102]|eukprot:OEU10449.1 hypothetical protein FRACYDRAFT_246840 [Fragilariopsis cylindrus CCMP1102]